MIPAVSLTFLGTCSGGGPLLNRHCSSSVLQVGSSLWMIDCAEGTWRQLIRTNLRKNTPNKIFITHMHGDHTFGVVPLLRQIMTSVHSSESTELKVELFGPTGLRELVRMTLRLTHTVLNGRYVVHELLTKDDTPYPSDASSLGPSELPGRDIICDDEGYWRSFGSQDGFEFDAGPIVHRVISLGYIFREGRRPGPVDPETVIQPIVRNLPALRTKDARASVPSILQDVFDADRPMTLPDGTVILPPPPFEGRKIVILGDTSDATRISELAMDASLLVHEATNAPISPQASSRRGRNNDTEEKIREKAIGRGHSTASMAGSFAKSIRARRLVMNHFSGKFPPASHPSYPKSWGGSHHIERGEKRVLKTDDAVVLREIERQATQAWLGTNSQDFPALPGSAAPSRPSLGRWTTAMASWDFMQIKIASHDVQGSWLQEVDELFHEA